MFNFLKQKPDFIVNNNQSYLPYLNRWWIIPRNNYFNIYLHKMQKDDDDRALHCHPYHNMSIILRGGYYEYYESNMVFCQKRKPGNIIFRKAEDAHMLKLYRDEQGKIIPSWSLFITGPRIREWGFWPNGKFIPWKEFLGVK